MGVSSYGAGTESGDLVFTKELRLDVRGRDVLLVDDILDTGKTMSRVLPKIRALKPRRIKICVLLDKPSRRTEDVKADYVGFEIPDFFVVGYGLDFAERYRNLPFVGVLHPHVYKQACKRVNEAALSQNNSWSEIHQSCPGWGRIPGMTAKIQRIFHFILSPEF